MSVATALNSRFTGVSKNTSNSGDLRLVLRAQDVDFDEALVGRFGGALTDAKMGDLSPFRTDAAWALIRAR